jgi:hypothetical protein
MRLPALLLLLGLSALAACAGHPGAGTAGDYVGGSIRAECAPFARALTGVRLQGDAADWWAEASGRYARQSQPEEGSVLVLRRSARLPYGHVAVVSRVLSSRQILVTQANWVHHRISTDQPVIDLSAGNDWSLVRIWWPPAGALGTTGYAAYGFIRPDHPATHQQIIAGVPRAIRRVSGG